MRIISAAFEGADVTRPAGANIITIETLGEEVAASAFAVVVVLGHPIEDSVPAGGLQQLDREVADLRVIVDGRIHEFVRQELFIPVTAR